MSRESLSQRTARVIDLPTAGSENAPTPEQFQLPDFDSEFSDILPIGHEEYKGGSINSEIALMDDGTPYPLVTGIPAKKDIKSDTAVVFTTAWMTASNGHNRHTLHKIMKLGYPTVMIGPEGQYRNKSLNVVGRLLDASKMSLPRTVYNMNRVLDEKLDQIDARPDKIIVLGESRGAMTGVGFSVEQYAGDRTSAYSDITAPCFARKPDINEVPAIITQLGSEVVTLGKLALELFGPRLKYYGATLHKDPEYYAKEVIKAWSLMNGDAGKLAKARRWHPMHVRKFVNDGWSQENEWEDLYNDDDLVHVESIDGYHLDIAKRETLRNIGMRLARLSEIRGFDGEFDSKQIRDDVIPAAKDAPKIGRRPRLSKSAA